MKYIKKPEIVEAKIFEWGDEDGVERYYHERKKIGTEGYPGADEKLRSFQYGKWRPYVVIGSQSGTIQHINEGDWIVTDTLGNRHAMPDKMFHLLFQEYKDPYELL